MNLETRKAGKLTQGQMIFGWSFRNLALLKAEIAAAVYNWETRRGLPHYDGGLGALIHADMMLAKSRSSLRRAAETSTRAACAPRNQEERER
jgi:hypothetical protein